MECINPEAVLLPGFTRVEPCGWPNSARVTLMGHAVLSLCWIVATSASAADGITLLTVTYFVCTGPLSRVGLAESEEYISERK